MSQFRSTRRRGCTILLESIDCIQTTECWKWKSTLVGFRTFQRELAPSSRKPLGGDGFLSKSMIHPSVVTGMRVELRLSSGGWRFGQLCPRMQSTGAALVRSAGRSEVSRCRS